MATYKLKQQFYFWKFIWATIVITFIVGVIPSSNANSLDQKQVFEKILDKLSGVKTLKINFNLGKLRYSGILFVDLTGKYRLELKKDSKTDRIIVTNGKKVWNYSPFEKKVVISSLETEESSGLQNFFAQFSKDFAPLSYTKELSSELGSNYILKVKSNSTNQVVKIFLTEQLDIKGVEFENDGKPTFYKILKIEYNPKIKKNFFEFKIPRGIEVIDLSN
jgi:outer membrane lipoprotein-sorting protein